MPIALRSASPPPSRNLTGLERLLRMGLSVRAYERGSDVDGVRVFREQCEAVAAAGYPGLTIR